MSNTKRLEFIAQAEWGRRIGVARSTVNYYVRRFDIPLYGKEGLLKESEANQILEDCKHIFWGGRRQNREEEILDETKDFLKESVSRLFDESIGPVAIFLRSETKFDSDRIFSMVEVLYHLFIHSLVEMLEEKDTRVPLPEVIERLTTKKGRKELIKWLDSKPSNQGLAWIKGQAVDILFIVSANNLFTIGLPESYRVSGAMFPFLKSVHLFAKKSLMSGFHSTFPQKKAFSSFSSRCFPCFSTIYLIYFVSFNTCLLFLL